MYQEKILQSFVKPEPRSRVPDFHVTRQPHGWTVCDAGKPIAFFGETFYMDVWSFSPFEPYEMANEQPPGKVRDLHTVHNTFVNFPLPSQRATDLAPDADDSLPPRWRWVKRRGNELRARITRTFPQGERLRYDLCVRYDPRWGRYRYLIDVDAWKLTSDGMEPVNMMMAGALASRPEQRRWTHSIWEDPDGNLKRLVHSNALFHCTDYADHLWRNKNAPYEGAWVAYGAHSSFNPAMLIHHTNVPIHFGTCSQLFDEHVIWGQAGLDQLEDGFFRFRMCTELVNLGPDLARDLLERAADPPRPKKWRHEMIALPFRMDTINSFEKPVDPWQPEECPIIALDKDDSAVIRWDSNEAHTGRHSIRFDGRQEHQHNLLFPVGAVCNVKPHSRYRLSAWVKTKRVERFARLELDSYEYTYSNVIDTAASPALAGTRDWTKLSVELDSGDEAYLMPKMVLYDVGTAWFDDVTIEEAT